MDYDEMVVAAWAEFKIAEGMHGMRDGVHDTPAAPRWWIVEELGHGAGEQHSLYDTCTTLAATNQRALLLLDEADRPYRVTFPKNFMRAEPPKRRPSSPDEPTFEHVLAMLKARLFDDKTSAAHHLDDGDINVRASPRMEGVY